MTRHAEDAEVIIVGYGLEYLIMGLNALRSVRESNPDVRTTFLTNIPLSHEPIVQWVDRLIHRDEPSDRNRLVKTSVLDFAECERVLYLDADVEVTGDLSPAWTLLERFDVLLQGHPVPVHKPFELSPGVPGALFPHFSGGLFFLRNDRPAREFLANWQMRLQQSGLDHDQPALARTVFDLPATRLLVLNSIWQMDVQHIDVVLMGDPLFRKTGARPIVVHHHDAHRSREYAGRLREMFDVATASLPHEVATSAEFVRVREKFRRTSSRLFSNRITRHPYLAVMHRIGLRRHGVDADVLFRRDETRGLGFRPNASGLWDDDVSPV
jgi:hypothetical protein